MTTKTLVILCLSYIAIGRVIHEETEPNLRDKKLWHYSIEEFAIYFADLFLWFPFMLIAIIKYVRK